MYRFLQYNTIFRNLNVTLIKIRVRGFTNCLSKKKYITCLIIQYKYYIINITINDKCVNVYV